MISNTTISPFLLVSTFRDNSENNRALLLSRVFLDRRF